MKRRNPRGSDHRLKTGATAGSKTGATAGSKTGATTSPELGEFRLQAAPVEFLQAAEGEESAKRFSCLAYNGGVMTPHYPGYRLVINLAGMQAAGDPIPALRDHDPARPVGQGTLAVAAGNARVTGTLCGPDEYVAPVIQAAGRGFQWRASLGGWLGDVRFIAEEEKVQVNGKTFKGPVYVAGKSIIAEVSFLAIAADGKTQVKIAAMAQGGGTHMDPQFKAWLQANGYADPESLSAEQLKPLEAAWKAESAEPGTPEPETPEPPARVQASGAGGNGVDEPDALIAQRRARLAAEDERLAALDELAERYPFAAGRKIVAQARREGWDAVRTERDLLRASRPAAPAIHAPESGAATPEVLEAAVLTAAGWGRPRLEKQFKIEVLEAAARQHRQGLGLQELLLQAASANGYAGRPVIRAGNVREVLRAAFSGVDISGILSNVANKSILAAFLNVESVWRSLARIGSVSDFKTVTRYRLTAAATYEKIGPAGKIKHGELGEESFTNKADTYAKMFGLTREDIINDDLGALNSVTQILGRGAGLAINGVFWPMFLDNATFFTTARNNYASGSATALSVDALTTAEQMFLDQVDSEGNPLALSGAVLVVPTALKTFATQLMISTQLQTTDGIKALKVPTSNPHAGKFSVACSAYLSNSKFTGYSAKAWYLVANPLDLAVIEVVFLDGQENPTIESADADFDELGIQFRGYHDFGVSLQDYRAGIKMAGE